MPNKPGSPRKKPEETASATSDGDGSTMNQEGMMRLKEMHLAPFIQLATILIGKRRHSGGNMFRHQIDTLGILIDYGYLDSVLLKASLVHDILEDIPDFNRDLLLDIDSESDEVYKLVLEVTKRPVETKPEFLMRILDYGSTRALILKSADRISNVISLGYVTDVAFIRRYTDETEKFLYPIAARANMGMHDELVELVKTRRDYLNRCFEI